MRRMAMLGLIVAFAAGCLATLGHSAAFGRESYFSRQLSVQSQELNPQPDPATIPGQIFTVYPQQPPPAYSAPPTYGQPYAR